MTLPRVGVIGVGAMGMGVARALLAKGFAVTVRDIVAERQAEACSVGARAAPNAAELARAVDVAIMLVVDAAQTRDVLLGAQGLAGARSSAAVMMCSTISPDDTEEIARTLPGVDFLDAPISGGPARAHSGTLSMMASGSSAAFARCAPVIEAMAAKCFRVGERPGDGSRMKVVNNMLAAANLAAGCEAMAMASRLGLDLRLVAEVVNASSGGSWIFADRMARALEGDYAPRAAARVLLKDVGLFVGEARKLGLTAPMAECAREIFHDTVERGLAEEDDAAVLKRYAAAWKVRVP
jgi:3-hydroxyisobutyrate dehydrogenase-like beta-hydroxyacid dehydrogenase